MVEARGMAASDVCVSSRANMALRNKVWQRKCSCFTLYAQLDVNVKECSFAYTTQHVAEHGSGRRGVGLFQRTVSFAKTT